MKYYTTILILLILLHENNEVKAAEENTKPSLKPKGLKGSHKKNTTESNPLTSLGDSYNKLSNYGGIGYQKNMAAITASSVMSTLIGSTTGHFKEKAMIVDGKGNMHVRLNRYYEGIKVYGGDVIVHMDPMYEFIDFSTSAAKKIQLDTITPSLSSSDASITAQNEFGDGLSRFSPKLIVYAGGDYIMNPVLSYLVNLYGVCDKDDMTPVDYTVIVDAQTGEIVDSWNNIKIFLPTKCNDGPIKQSSSLESSLFEEQSYRNSGRWSSIKAVNATGYGFHNGHVSFTTNYNKNESMYEMMDPTRGNNYVVDASKGFKVCEDVDNAWTSESNHNIFDASQTASVDVQYGVKTTWDFLKYVLGRNGLDDNGQGIMSRIRYGKNYNNAFYNSWCSCMTFGDGDGVILNPLTTLDVVGHEIAHGITDKTANLIYSGESGGLNEATSDIFGTMIEFYATNSTDEPDHLIGEGVFMKDGNFLRSMIQPSSDGKSSDCYYNGVGDLNVHYSSGPANHFFYLLSEGTKDGIPSKTCIKDLDKNVATGFGTIDGVGKNKATQIWYLALSAYMTSSTNYAGAKDATINACNDLYGVDSKVCVTLIDSWNAVLV